MVDCIRRCLYNLKSFSGPGRLLVTVHLVSVGPDSSDVVTYEGPLSMNRAASRTLLTLLLVAVVFPTPLLFGQRVPVGLRYVPEDAILVSHIRADLVLKSPQVQQQAVEVVTAVGKKYLGFDPMRINAVTIVVTPQPEWYRREMPDASEIVQVFAVVQTTETLNEETFFARIGEVLEEVISKEDQAEKLPQLKGAIFRTDDPPLDYLAAHLVDEHTFILGNMNIMKGLVTKGPHAELTGPAKQFAQQNQDADVMAMLHVGPIRDLVDKQIAEEGLPPELEPYRELPNEAASIALRLSFQNGLSAYLKVDAVDEAAADRLEERATSTIKMGREKLLAPAQVRLESDDEVTVAVGKYQQRVVNALFDKLNPTRDGKSLSLHVDYRNDDPNGWDHAIAGVLASILLPEVENPAGIEDSDTP